VTGARSRQKLARRETMLAAASRLFERQGYSRTTFEQIAEAASVGVATVYNYFGSKEGVVKALLMPDLERVLENGERIIAKPPPDPASAVVRLLGEYGELGGHHWARRDLLKMTILPGVGNDGVLASFVNEADMRVKAQIRELLRRLRGAGRLTHRLDLQDASDVIFAVFNQHFAAYLTCDDLSYSAMFAALRRHIRLLFSPWRPPLQSINKGHPMKRLNALNVACISILTFAAGNDAALAQQAGSLEEIIVTAQKRSESIQDVPLSITALSSEVLEQRSVQSFADYGNRIPNLGFAHTGDGVSTSRTISIRGISGDGVTGFYLDETPLPDSIDPRIVDIDRIEVLRGPQGTLYGARSMGGTVRLLTKQPDVSATTGRVHLGISDTSNASDQNYLFDGAINVPLGDSLAARAVGFYEKDAGFFKRTFCESPADVAAGICFPNSSGGAPVGSVDNIAELETYGGSVAMTWHATESLAITPRFMYQKAEYNGLPLADIFAGGGPAGYPAPPDAFALPELTPRSFEQRRFFDIAEGGFDRWSLATLGIRYDTGIGEIVSSTSYFDRRVEETEDQTDFIYANFLAVSLITGAPGTALPGSITEIKDYQRFVQEIRFASDLDGPLQFVVGGFYSDTHGRVPFAAKYPAAVIPGFASGSGFDLVVDENGVPIFLNPDNPDEIFGSDYETTIKEPAAFGELSYEFTDRLKATVGLRWYEIETTAGGFQEGFAFGGARGVDPEVTTKEDGVNPKVQVDYKLTPEHMIYAMAAKGFRPGGIVPAVPLSPALGCDVALAQIGVTPEQARGYESDSLWNYELGAKTSWLENRLTVNAAVFFIDWKDIQQNVLLPCGFQFRANAGAAESKGFELELHARLTEGLDVSLGIGHQDAEITESGATIPQLQPGDRVYQVPDWTGNASLFYTHSLGAALELTAGVDYAYVGDSVSANNTPFTPRVRPSYDLLDARIGVGWDHFDVALVGRNLTDEHVNFGDNRSIAAETPGRPRLVTNQPRTLGLEFSAEF
jgi:outer membrane receptor protein involved in Fe transport/AcrR family transcriptional regulator